MEQLDGWIGEVVGLMHINHITQIELAEKMSVTNDYISMILRGVKAPKNIETKIRMAINEIIIERKNPA